MVIEVTKVLGLNQPEVRTPLDLAILAEKGVPRSAVERIVANSGVNLKEPPEPRGRSTRLLPRVAEQVPVVMRGWASR